MTKQGGDKMAKSKKFVAVKVGFQKEPVMMQVNKSPKVWVAPFQVRKDTYDMLRSIATRDQKKLADVQREALIDYVLENQYVEKRG